MKKNKYSILVGLYALLLPQVMFGLSFLPPDDPAAAGGNDDGDLSPGLKSLLGLADDDTLEVAAAKAKAEADEAPKKGMSLMEAIAAEPSEEEKAKAAADKKTADDAAAAKAKEEAEKVEADKKVADKKAADEAAAANPTPIRVVKKKTASDLEAEKKASDEKAEAEKRAATAKDWEATLLEEERDQLDLARAAEGQNPTKYKGLAAKTEKFIRDNAARTGADDFDPDDTAYKAWVDKERPNLTATEVRQIERERGASVARREAEAKSQEVLDKTFRMVEAPRVKAEADAYFVNASTEAMPDDLAKVFKEDKAKAATEFPFEYQIVEQEVDRHASVVEDMLALTRINPDTRRPLMAYDHSNPLHVAAAELINTVDAEFKKNGGDARVKGGKTFLPRAELASVPVADRAKYWTFTANEIAHRSTPLVKARIVAKIASEHERMKKLGFNRRAPAAAVVTPAAAAVAAKENETAPPAPRQGAGTGTNGTGSGADSATDRLLRESGMAAPV